MGGTIFEFDLATLKRLFDKPFKPFLGAKLGLRCEFSVSPETVAAILANEGGILDSFRGWRERRTAFLANERYMDCKGHSEIAPGNMSAGIARGGTEDATLGPAVRANMRTMKPKSKIQKPNEIEVYPDAWERFEKAVDTVMRSPPQSKTKTAKARAPSPARGGRRGGREPA